MSATEPRRDQGLEVAVARVGQPGGRGRLAAIIWAAALVALVAVAIGERRAEPEPAPVAVAGPHADPGPAASAVPRRRPLVRATAPPARTTGEDGLMGSLAFDLNRLARGPGGVGGASREGPTGSS